MPRGLPTSGPSSPLVRYGVALIAVCLATISAIFLSPYLSPTLALIFLFAVIVSAHVCGFWPGIWATCLSVLSIVLIAPANWINSGPHEFERLTVFVITGAILSWLCAAYGRGRDAIRAREYWFQQIFEASRDAIFLVDANARFIEVNRAACELTGYSHEELLSMSIPELHDEEDMGAFQNYFGSIMEGKDVVSEALIRKKDGTKIAAEFSNRRMTFRGKPAMHTSARDITDRKRAEEALKLSEERFRNVVENASDIIFAHDLDGRYTSVNEAVERITGYTREEALASTLSQIIVPEDLELVRNMISRKVGGEEATTYELQIIAKDGGRIALEVTSRLIVRDGTPVGVHGIARDVTERKRAAEALAESEQRYRVVAETASDAIITINQESEILFANISAETIFGYTVDEMIGQSLTMLMPDYLRHLHSEGVQRYTSTGRRHFSWKGMELPGLHKSGGEVPLEISFSEFQRNGLRYFTSVVRDITQRKQAEEKLSARERQLAAAQQVAKLGSWEWDIAKDTISWSDQLYRIYGLEPQQFGATYAAFLDRVHPFDRDFVHDVIANALVDHQPFTCDYRIIRRDQVIRTVHAQGDVVLDDTGRPIKMIGIGQDVTERHQEVEALRRAEENYRSIFENAVEGIFQSTPEGRFIAVNPAMARMYGYDSPEQMVAQRTDIEQQHYVDPKSRARLKRLLEADDKVHGLEAQVYRKDGSEFWTSENVRAVRDVGGALLYYEGAIEDITKRKQWEEAREQLLKARGQLLQRLVSAQEDERRRIARELHDQLGQQITALMLGLKLLKDSTSFQPEAMERVDHLQECAAELGRELHNIAWELRPSALDDLGLKSALGHYVENWSERTGKPVQFHSSGFNGQRLSAQVETTFYRIVQEALTNVLKHAEASNVSLILERRENHALAIIEDDGRGFDVDAIFNTSGSEQRFGLLGIKERLALVFGTLQIESTPGTGTTVFVRIPTPPASLQVATP